MFWIILYTPLILSNQYGSCCFKYFIHRNNSESYSRGVLTEHQYEDDKKRRLTNLQICFIGWMYETMGNLITIVTPFLHDLDFQGVHYPDVVLMFVLIPFVHLMNDEGTKTVITDENWYQGVRHMLGIHNDKGPR